MKVENDYKILAKELVHCPWNPRGEITVESVADLTASIKAKGLLQDIGVMAIPEGLGHGEEEFWVIYGNRRFVAAKAAGMELIPCKLYSDLSETDAREITRIENEVRLGIDPLKDAELLHSFIAAGKTYTDVALMFGTSPATVCRREKLVNLNAGIRQLVQDNPNVITTNCLENIAVYPDEIQRKVITAIKSRAGYQSQVNWRDVRGQFDGLTRELDTAPFIKDVDSTMVGMCRECLDRTGCQADLFGVVDGSLGRCMESKCFDKCIESWKAWKLDKLIPESVTERVEVTMGWQLDNAAYKDKPGKDRKCAYWHYDSWNQTFRVRFGPSQAAMQAIKDAEEKARAEQNERSIEKGRILSAALSKVQDGFSGSDLTKPKDGSKMLGAIRAHFDNYTGDPWHAAFDLLVFLIGLYDILDCDGEPFDADAFEKDPALESYRSIASALKNCIGERWQIESLVNFLKFIPQAQNIIGITAEEMKVLKGANK